MDLERETPLVWTLLWLFIGCQSIGAFAEGGREAALTGGDDQNIDQNSTVAIVLQFVNSVNTLMVLAVNDPDATSCYPGMANDTTKQYQRLELLRHNTLGRDILCDTQTDGGGWIVIQRRTTGDVDFYRNWTEYKNGFGTPPGDFWLGNEAIYELTNRDDYELRIDFNDGTQDLFAVYTNFSLNSEADNYRLRLGSHSGTLGEYDYWWGLSYSNGRQFSTYDRDNGESCAYIRHSAWWYYDGYGYFCTMSNLNGGWGDNTTQGLYWATGAVELWAKSTEMKMRRVDL